MLNVSPDDALDMALKMPWPANRLAYAILRRALKAYGRRTGKLIRIRFGSAEIDAPLAHPSVYWRYRPYGVNLNYVRLAKTVCAARQGVIIDVGANIGDGVALLRGNGIDRKIIAIEGAEEFFLLLRRNAGYLGKVEVFHSLLSDNNLVNFSLEVANGTGRLLKDAAATTMVTLDTLAETNSFTDVALLKTDTDGFDAKVIGGSRRILRDARPVIFSEVDDTLLRANGGSASDFIAMLDDAGYDTIAAWNHDGYWLGSRPIAQGVSDWIATYPGGPGVPYIDVAAFKTNDRHLANKFIAAETRISRQTISAKH